jgi:1-deoxy-D-xylulose-5-phosphate synthase
VLTLEDAALQGGMGSAVLEFMADHSYRSLVRRLGIPDRWVEHGTQEELYKECDYDTAGIIHAAREFILLPSSLIPHN